MHTVQIGSRRIGPGHPCFLIAEVGTTCLGDMDNALRLIDAAAAAGMDAVKFQMIDPDQLSDVGVEYRYSSDGEQYSANMKDMFRRLDFSDGDWARLRDACRDRGMEFFATVDHLSGVDRLDALGVEVHKMGAWDINYRSLVEKIAATGKPMFMDLGPATREEMEEFSAWFQAAGGECLMYMHDFHTAEDSQMNMRAITHINATQEWPGGFSSPGLDADLDVAAIALGAMHIEKRLILSRSLHAFHADESLEPDELKEWAARIRHVERALGREAIEPSDLDREMSRDYYRSVCTLAAVPAGGEFTPVNLDAKRPGTGMHPRHLNELWGRTAARDLPMNHLLDAEDAV